MKIFKNSPKVKVRDLKRKKVDLSDEGNSRNKLFVQQSSILTINLQGKHNKNIIAPLLRDGAGGGLIQDV